MLTARQKRELRALGRNRHDDCTLGRDGLSASFCAQAGELLGRHELIKLRFGEVKGRERKALADEVAAALDAQCIAIVGRTMLLYRPNPDLPPDMRVLVGDSDR